jgi:hypothetical protein
MPFVRRHSTGMFLSTNSQHFTVGQTAGEKKQNNFTFNNAFYGIRGLKASDQF